MKNANTLFSALVAGSAMLLAAPVMADSHKQKLSPNSFENLAHVFEAADLDDSNTLSRDEYIALRLNSVDGEFLPAYQSNTYAQIVPTVEKSFAALDRNSDGMIGLTEFMNAANDKPAPHPITVYAWDWTPEFMTVSYYLQANELDTDEVIGRDVVNLKGNTVGKIADVIRAKKTGNYYAMINIDGSYYPRYMNLSDRQAAGVPLSDILLGKDDEVLYVSNRGEDWLKEADARMIEEFEHVDQVYALK